MSTTTPPPPVITGDGVDVAPLSWAQPMPEREGMSDAVGGPHRRLCGPPTYVRDMEIGSLLRLAGLGPGTSWCQQDDVSG